MILLSFEKCFACDKKVRVGSGHYTTCETRIKLDKLYKQTGIHDIPKLKILLSQESKP